jgi:hypothetical protein
VDWTFIEKRCKSNIKKTKPSNSTKKFYKKMERRIKAIMVDNGPYVESFTTIIAHQGTGSEVDNGPYVESFTTFRP